MLLTRIPYRPLSRTPDVFHSPGNGKFVGLTISGSMTKEGRRSGAGPFNALSVTTSNWTSCQWFRGAPAPSLPRSASSSTHFTVARPASASSSRSDRRISNYCCSRFSQSNQLVPDPPFTKLWWLTCRTDPTFTSRACRRGFVTIGDWVCGIFRILFLRLFQISGTLDSVAAGRIFGLHERPYRTHWYLMIVLVKYGYMWQSLL